MRVTASFTIPQDLLKRVDDLADAQRLSRSQLLERWILDAIEGESLAVKMMASPAVMSAMTAAFSRPEVIKQFGQAVNAELSSEQLELFNRAMIEAQEQAKKAVVASKGKTAPPRSRRKRSK